MKLFKRKEPIEPEEMRVEDVLTNVYELHPDRKYVFWWEQSMNPQHMEIVSKQLQSKGITGTIICGLKAPRIYEFEDKEIKYERDQTDGESKP